MTTFKVLVGSKDSTWVEEVEGVDATISIHSGALCIITENGAIRYNSSYWQKCEAIDGQIKEFG